MTADTSQQVAHRRPVSIVAIGAGNRMRTYMHYIELHPNEVKLVGIVEPNEIRRNEMARKYNVPQSHCFNTHEEFFASGIKVDGVVIGTPENAHFEPAMAAINAGCHVLLEKPIAQTLDECLAIARAARAKGVIVSVCHVLRYHPFFLKIKELVDSGDYGKIISIQHSEGVGINRNAHSYVRGVMNRTDKGNPMLIAKCCHDVDFLLWLTGKHCRRLSSFGSLRWFKAENAPKGSATRCINCSIEKQCPYSAVDLYLRRHEWISNFDNRCGQPLDDVLRQQMQNGDFGRCIYHCDNDVVDNQTLIMELEDQTTISLTMEVFTLDDVRRTRIGLTGGEIVSDERKIEATDFLTRTTKTFDYSAAFSAPFHAGSDLSVVQAFIESIQGGTDSLHTSIEDSLESHLVCYEAERSRLTGKTIDLQPESLI